MVRYDDEFEKIGVAIWCGLVFLLTGIIAVVAAHRVQRFFLSCERWNRTDDSNMIPVCFLLNSVD